MTKSFRNATAALLYHLSTDWNGTDIVSYLTAQAKTLSGDNLKLVNSFIDGFKAAPTPPTASWPREVLQGGADALESGAASIEYEVNLNEMVAGIFASSQSDVDTGAGDDSNADIADELSEDRLGLGPDDEVSLQSDEDDGDEVDPDTQEAEIEQELNAVLGEDGDEA